MMCMSPVQMDKDNSSMQRSKPPQTVRDNLAKIDAELLRCRGRLEDLRMLNSLSENSAEKRIDPDSPRGV